MAGVAPRRRSGSADPGPQTALAEPGGAAPSRRLARLIASGGGSGYAPIAPGTAGSLAALVLGAGLLALHPAALAAALALAVAGGLWAIRHAAVRGDPGWVVIDEFAGQFLTLLALARPSPMGLLTAFALFRLLDVTKPGPVGWADRRGGAVGIMADDLLAGLIAGGLLLVVRWQWPGVLA
jgi:phosphatidylglycerophosphatase A